MEPFSVLILSMLDAHPDLEALFLPADEEAAARAGLVLEPVDLGRALTEISIEAHIAAREPVSRVTVNLDDFDPIAALGMQGVPVSATATGLAAQVRDTIGIEPNPSPSPEANPTPYPYPVPILGIDAVAGFTPSPFQVDGVIADGIVLLMEGRDVVGVLGLPLVETRGGIAISDSVCLVVADPDQG